MEDPGAYPQPRWASFHLVFTQQSRGDALQIPAVREGDTPEAGGEDESVPLLSPLSEHLAQRKLLQPRQTAAQGEASARPSWPRRRDCGVGDTRDRASGHREPHRDCWVPRLRAQIRNALSSGWKRDVRLQDLLLCREGRHEVRCCRETIKDPTSLSPAPWGPSQMLEACCGLPRKDSQVSWEEGPSWSLGAAPSAGDRDTHHSR